MFWRVRTTLADRPGALAVLAQRCGEQDVNILGLQIFPGVSGVTDELVLRAPAGWTLADVAALVESAGGTHVSVGACTERALVDGPTRYLSAVRQVLHGDPVADVLAALLDADEGVAPGLASVQDVLVVDGPPKRVELRRTAPFTATEHARAAAFVEAVTELAGPERAAGALPPADTEASAGPAATGGEPVVRPAGVADTGALMAMHRRCSAETVLRHYRAPLAGLDLRMARRLLVGGAGALVVSVADQVVGVASLDAVVDGSCEASVLVEDGWQRRGLGARLLSATARYAAQHGASELVLRAPADSPAAVALVFSSGLRARVRLSGDELVLTVSTRGLAPAGAVAAPAVAEETTAPAPA